MSDVLELIDRAFENGVYNVDVCWLALRHEQGIAVVPVSHMILPANPQGGVYDAVVEQAVKAIGLPEDEDFTIHDKDGPIERLTVGFFKPVTLPSGREVQYAELLLKPSAKL